MAYHRDHAEQWVLRLGDGTEESHRRTQAGLDALWRFTGEMFQPVEGLDGPDSGVDREELRTTWLTAVTETVERATLNLPRGRSPGAGRPEPAGRACTPSRSAA
ncbi:phenylacetate-CoA oxygenase subunit PaaC [Streptomyces californicus]